MSIDCMFRDDGAHIFHDRKEVAVFHFDNYWDLMTVDIEGETYNVNSGYASEEEVQKWLTQDPGYDFHAYGSTEVVAVTRRIGYGVMICLGVIDAYGMWPSRVISKIVECDDGRTELSLFDGDSEREDIFEI